MSYDSNNQLEYRYMNMRLITPVMVNRFTENNTKDDTDLEIDNKDDIKSDSDSKIDEDIAHEGEKEEKEDD